MGGLEKDRRPRREGGTRQVSSGNDKDVARDMLWQKRPSGCTGRLPTETSVVNVLYTVGLPLFTDVWEATCMECVVGMTD